MNEGLKIMKQTKVMIWLSIGLLVTTLGINPLSVQALDSTTQNNTQLSDSSISNETSHQTPAGSRTEPQNQHVTNEEMAPSSPNTSTSEQTTATDTEVVPVEKLEVSISKPKVAVGETAQISISILPSTSTQTLHYQVSNPAIVSVDESGKVIGLSLGEAEITVSSQDGTATSTVKITVIKPSVIYQTHVQSVGWQSDVTDGAISGTQGKSLRLEAIKIKLTDTTYSGQINYQVHIQGIGWQVVNGNPYVSDGELAGTTGQAKRLEGIKISLTDELATHYDIYYRVHIQKIGWLSWAKNGEAAGSQGLSARLEGIEIQLLPKGMANLDQSRAFVSDLKLSYQTHIQGIGWQDIKGNNDISGTTGQGRRLEALKIMENQTGLTGTVVYQTHIQSIGWQSKVPTGSISGTVGQGKRLEAVNICLTGELAKFYDIYYRVHIQEKGWLPWTKNGENAGSSGASKRLEALQIQLVLKGNPEPATGRAFLTADDFKPWIGKPYYYSQWDSRWAGNRFNSSTIGPSGCVPTSLAMVLKGSYGMNLTPADVAARMDYYSGWPVGASGKDIIATTNSYGHSVEVVTSQSVAEQRLREGYPLIWLENVGIGHAVVSFGNSGGKTEVLDPYNRQFFNGWYDISYLWNRPSADPMDWDAGRPFFVIK